MNKDKHKDNKIDNMNDDNFKRSIKEIIMEEINSKENYINFIESVNLLIEDFNSDLNKKYNKTSIDFDICEKWENDLFNEIEKLESKYNQKIDDCFLENKNDGSGEYELINAIDEESEKLYFNKSLELINMIERENNIISFSLSNASNSIYLVFENEFEVRLSNHNRKYIYDGCSFYDHNDNNITIRIDKLDLNSCLNKFNELKNIHFEELEESKGQ